MKLTPLAVALQAPPFKVEALSCQVCTCGPEHQVVLRTLEHNEVPTGQQRDGHCMLLLQAVYKAGFWGLA